MLQYACPRPVLQMYTVGLLYPTNGESQFASAMLSLEEAVPGTWRRALGNDDGAEHGRKLYWESSSWLDIINERAHETGNSFELLVS